MIIQSTGRSGEKIYTYDGPKINETQEFFKRLIKSFKNYAESNGIEAAKVEFNFKLINEINIRVDKRRDYYIIFHEETLLSEVREAALIAFWILKFKPFLITSEEGKDYNFNVNCGFAAYVVLGAVSEYIKRTYNGEKKLNMSVDYLDKLKYAFKYWDLSKESVMLIAETLCRCTKDKE